MSEVNIPLTRCGAKILAKQVILRLSGWVVAALGCGKPLMTDVVSALAQYEHGGSAHSLEGVEERLRAGHLEENARENLLLVDDRDCSH